MSLNGHIKIYLSSLSAYFRRHILAGLKQKVFFAGKLRFEPLEMLESKEQFGAENGQEISTARCILVPHPQTHCKLSTNCTILEMQRETNFSSHLPHTHTHPHTSKEFQLQFGLPQWGSIR